MDITMPQLGETVTEGTITRWMKQVGDTVAIDEPLFEVSTDKVDSEVPSPVAGVLSEIIVHEGDTVDVGARLAVIGEGASAPAQESAPAPPVAEAPPAAPPPEPAAEATPQPEPSPVPPPPRATPAPPPPAPAPAAPAPAAPPPSGNGGSAPQITSPVVRHLIAERGLDPGSIRGTGEGGRITRRDVMAASASAAPPSAPPSAPPQSTQAPPAPPQPTGAAVSPATGPAVPSSLRPSAGDEVIAFDNIRRRTAEHMVLSKATSAHVYTSVEVDYERVDRVRQAHQATWRAQEGFSLTYLPFIVRAFCDAAREFPNVNASVDGDSLVVHHDLHLGIAVDLDYKGLIAPVIRGVDNKRMRAVAREIRDLAGRARSKQLGPDEIIGGTFTITNMGPFGTLMTLPIINQPQVAILATDAIQKRAVVVEGPDGDDAIAVHPVGVLALAWDHRAFDGAYAAGFLHEMREILETRDWEVELA